ncbi:MAG: MFS transporter [Rickettsiales bacterium]
MQRNFLALLATQFFGALNDNIFRTTFTTALAFGIIQTNHSSTFIYLSLGLFILPYILFSSIAGQISDKLSKQKVITTLKFIEIFISLFAIFAFYTKNNYLLIFLIFISGIQSSFFGPVKYSALPEILQRKLLLKGNAFISSSTFVSILLGGIVGSYFVKDENSILLLAILMFFNSFIGFLCSLYISNMSPKNKSLQINFNFIQSTHRLITSMKDKKFIKLSVLGISWLWFLGGVFMAAMPIIFNDLYQLNTQYYTFYLITFTIGVSAGSFASGVLLKNNITSKYVPITLFVTTFLLFDLSFALTNKSLIRTYIDLFFIAFCGGVYSVPLYTILQHESQEHERSQNIAINNIFNSVFIIMASALLFVGQSLLNISFANLFFCIAILNLLVSFYSAILLPNTLIKFILKKVFSLLFRVKVVGLENYNQAGEKTIIVANHASYLDPALIHAFLPDKLIYAINTQQSKKWWIRPLLQMVDTYSLDPSNPLALKSLAKSLSQKKRIVIFPEGRITTTGSLMKVYEGPAMIANRTKAKILPIKISGVEFSYFSKLQEILCLKLFPKITIEILPAETINLNPDLSLREKRYEAGMRLYDIMSNMLFKTTHYHQNIFDYFCSSAKKFGLNKEIIQDASFESVTYKKSIISSIALSRKMPQENRVGILMPNINVTVLLFLACQFSQKVAVMFNYSAGTKNIESAIKTSQIKTIVTSRKFIEKADLYQIISMIQQSKTNILYVEDIAQEISLFDKVSSFLIYLKKVYFYVNDINYSKLNNPSVILFTSGSEGAPKGVVLSHKNIQANIAQASSRIDFSPSDLVLNVLPIFHCYGLTGATLLPILSGIKIFLYPNPLHYRIIPEIAYDIGSTIIFGTNTFLYHYARFAHPYDFYKVRYAISGAEKLKEDTQKLWNEKFGIRILEGYGVTEAAPVISINTPMYYKTGTVGRVFPKIKYKLKKVEGIENGGELHISGPNIMLGYITEKKPNKIISPAYGYHNTGDIASIDKHGFLRILGRVKRFAKVGGEMVSLGAIEDIINRLWPDYQNGVISCHTDKGERIYLITNNKELNKTSLIKHFQESGFPEIYIPKEVIFSEKLPLVGTGKVDYPKLEKMVPNLRN